MQNLGVTYDTRSLTSFSVSLFNACLEIININCMTALVYFCIPVYKLWLCTVFTPAVVAFDIYTEEPVSQKEHSEVRLRCYSMFISNNISFSDASLT